MSDWLVILLALLVLLLGALDARRQAHKRGQTVGEWWASLR